jgi:hypothetical protein
VGTCAILDLDGQHFDQIDGETEEAMCARAIEAIGLNRPGFSGDIRV